jgi:hypothetical protein
VAALQDRGWWLGEGLARRRDGSSLCAQISATMVTGKTGKPICMMCSILDVTERKRAEEVRRISEERFQAVFESAKDCIFLKDRTPRPTEFTGQPCLSIIRERKTTTNNDTVWAVMVVGGGIGGIQTSLDLAGSGFKVYLVESQTGIGCGSTWSEASVIA